MKKIPLALILSLIFGSFLRLDHFRLASFWGDEAVSAIILESNKIGTLWARTFGSGNNPGFVFLMKLWSLFFGDSEASLRSLSIIFSLLSILIIYKLGKTLFNKSVAKWSSFLLATSTISIFFSHQARPYSLIIFLSICVTYYLIKLAQGGWSRKNIIIYTLIMFYSLYTHPWFFFLLATHFLIIFVYSRDLLRKFTAIYSLLFVAVIPLLFEMFTLIEGGVNAWIPKASLNTLRETFFYFTEGMALIYVAIIIIGLFIMYKKQKRKIITLDNNLKVLILLFIIPLGLGFTISLFAPMYSPGRHEMLILPYFILFLAYFAAKIKNKIIIFILIVLISSLAILITTKERKNIENYATDQKKAALFLAESVNHNDIIVLHYLNQSTFRYYLPRFTDKKYIEVCFPYLGNTDEKKKLMAINRINIFKIFNKEAREKMMRGLLNKKYIEEKIELGQEAQDYILQSIRENSDAKLWLVYDSQTQEGKDMASKLETELKLIKSHKFIKTERMDKLNLQFPMFFDYINEYERRY